MSYTCNLVSINGNYIPVVKKNACNYDKRESTVRNIILIECVRKCTTFISLREHNVDNKSQICSIKYPTIQLIFCYAR